MIAASRHVNKHVITGAVITAKRGTEPGVHKILANSNRFRLQVQAYTKYEWLVRNPILLARVYERTQMQSTQA